MVLRLPIISSPIRHEEFGVAGAVDMASFATHAGLARHLAENRWRTEGEIAETDLVGLAASDLGSEHLARLVERVLVEFGLCRQHCLVATDRKRHGMLLKGDDQKSESQGGDPGTSANHRDWASSVGLCSPSSAEAACSATTSSSLARRRV